MKKLSTVLTVLFTAIFATTGFAQTASWENAVPVKDVETKPVPVKQSSPKITPAIQGLSGSVAVSFVIDGEGKVRDAKVLKSTDDKLNKTATETVQEWDFQPAKNAGQPIAVRAMVKVRFAG